MLLTLLSALAGATAVCGGLMLLTNTLDTADFTVAATVERIGDDWWWYVIYLAVALAGIVVQARKAERLTASMREAWLDAGGHELRHT